MRALLRLKILTGGNTQVMSFILRFAALICFILALFHVVIGDISLLVLGLALWVGSTFFGPDVNYPWVRPQA